MLARFSSFSGPMAKLFRKIQDIASGFKTANLITRFEFDGGSWEGSTYSVATDISDYSVDGFISGSMSYGNGYLSVQGSATEYLRTANLNPYLLPANTSEIISVFLWIYPTANGIILGEQGTTNADSLWYDAQIQRNSSNNYLFGVWPYTMGTALITSTNTYALNEWHYVGYTYDGTTLRGYVNGSLQGTSTVNRQSPYNMGGHGMYYYVGFPTSTNMVTTPGAGVGQGPKAAFRLGAMHVYNVALTTTEVLANYNAQSANYIDVPQTGLILHVDDSSYPGTGTTWNDLSGSSNPLTLVNTPTFNSYGTYSGGYFSLNGTNQYFTAPSGFADFTSGITVISIADMGTAGNWERIIDFGQGEQDDNIVFAREGTTNTLTFEFYNGSTMGLSVDLTSGITNNKWGFYGFKADGSTYTLFNGTASTTGSSNVLPQNVTRTLNYVGRSNWGVDAYMERYIGVLLIYNRALSDAEIDQVFDYYSNRYFEVPTNGLLISLDAGNTASYSGSGTTLNNLVGASFNHTISDSTFAVLNGVKCFDCGGSNSSITVPQGTGPTLPTTGYTYITWARIKSDNSGYRTLLRSYLSDHPILVQINTDNLGFWDNQNNNFYDTGYDVTSIEEKWVQYTVVGDSSTSTFYINDEEVGTVNYGAGGNTHWSWSYPNQGFGHVANLYLYDRKLSFREIKQAYKQLYPRFITPFEITTDGLLMRLDANSVVSYPGSGSTWVDLAGTTQSITLVNTPTYTTGTPAYFDFNGTNEYGTGTGVTVPATAYTKSVWFMLDTYTDNNLVSSITGGHFMFFNSTQYLYSGHNNWPSFVAYPSTTAFALNTWYNATLTFNTTDGMKLYVNGQLDSTYTANKSAHNGVGSTNLAAHLPGGNLLNGKISKVYTYDRALTAAEVLRNYDADREQFGL